MPAGLTVVKPFRELAAGSDSRGPRSFGTSRFQCAR
jgi:hypothetical protein